MLKSTGNLQDSLPEGLLEAVSQATGIPVNEFYFDRKRPQKNWKARHLIYGLLWYEFGWRVSKICAAIWPDRDALIQRQTIYQGLQKYDEEEDYLRNEYQEAKLLLNLS